MSEQDEHKAVREFVESISDGQRGDLKFLRNPMRWPHMLCPLKKRDPKVGDSYAVYIPGKFSEENMITLSRMTEEELEKVVWIDKTPEEVITEGWEVD